MAEAMVCLVVERLACLVEEEIRKETKIIGGVKKEVKNMRKKLNMIRSVVEDAEKRRVKEIEVKGWLEKLNGLCYDMDDVLDEWNTALLLHPSSAPKRKRVSLHHDIAMKIKELSTRLDEIYKEKNQFNFNEGDNNDSDVFKPIKTTIGFNESHVYGRDDDKDILVEKMFDVGTTNSHEENGIVVMSIVGTAGLGKTTLAQMVYNDEDVTEEFVLKLWVCVSDPFDEIQVAKAILESLGKVKESRDLHELETMLAVLKDEISEKKFLLVLDDVWNEDERLWEPLRNSLQNGISGSVVLVTTRNEKVAIMMGSTYSHRLGVLSNADSWPLFERIAFSGTTNDKGVLERVGREIVKKCHGMPLAIKTLAGLLRLKNTTEEWQNVLDSELWELEVAATELFPHLYLSLCDVPPIMRHCFTYCAIFPKDERIVVADLVKLWMAQGYLATSRSEEEVELRGREYFNDLAMRSFFQDLERDEFGEEIISCKMHAIIHDFAQFMAGKESLIMRNESSSSDSVRIRHLNWNSTEELTSVPSNCATGKLRSFLADSVAEELFEELLQNLKYVRAIRLKNANVNEIPKEIGSLLHLRYLNLSQNPLRELPEELCDLINLETLDISETDIYELPVGIGKLINLRHLMISESSMRDIPQSVENLTSLRTLEKFVVTKGNKLGCLKNLNHLCGSLEIFVDEDDDLVSEKIEMEKAELKSKKHIKKFQLIFYEMVDAEDFGDPSVLTDLIDVLGSPPNIEVLYLCALPTTRFPTWITSLYNLRNLTVECCELWSSMPPLGRLPHLENLWIIDLSFKHIGLEFLGVEGGVDMNATDGISSGEASSVVVAFPKLEKLSIKVCDAWEEWEDLTEKDEKSYVVFPRLHDLHIQGCLRLKTLPPRLLGMATSLESLSIQNCHTFLDRIVRERGLSSHFEEGFIGERRVSSSACFESNEAIGEFLRRLR